MYPVRDHKVMFYTYILKSEKSGRTYTGYTNNLRKRLSEYNSGKSAYTKKDKPYLLIYYEACLDEDDARSREKYLKSGMGKRYVKNRLKCFLSLTGCI
ncbi:MAG: GIY-YIG nuclease family protein [bacterium]